MAFHFLICCLGMSLSNAIEGKLLDSCIEIANHFEFAPCRCLPQKCDQNNLCF